MVYKPRFNLQKGLIFNVGVNKSQSNISRSANESDILNTAPISLRRNLA